MDALPRTAQLVFPTKTGNPKTHLLRRLKELADTAEVTGATLHKFRHTYAMRLLERGADTALARAAVAQHLPGNAANPVFVRMP